MYGKHFAANKKVLTLSIVKNQNKPHFVILIVKSVPLSSVQ